ncbi:MAG: hypothetical protein CMM18_02890 [Rhodospirillaceae bacterium]|nr:hypothetical protein [Rhodospirillaceae bacterium]
MQKNKYLKSNYILLMVIFLTIFFILFFAFFYNYDEKGPVLSGQIEKFVFSKKETNYSNIFWYDLKGNEIKLNEQRGKIVLINFWASWCLPCIRELPSIDKLSAGLDNREFKSIVINIDKRNRENSIRMFEDLDLHNLEYFYDSAGYLTSLLKIDVIPTTIIYNKNGDEIGRLVGEANWNSKDVLRFLKFFLE